MKMGLKLLIPCMEHRHKAQFSAKLVFTELYQCLRNGFKKDVKHQRSVFYNDGIQLMWQGEDHMKVGHGQEF
jgi:hypothetical protein